MTSRRDFFVSMSAGLLGRVLDWRAPIVIGVVTSRGSPYPGAEAGIGFGADEMRRAAVMIGARLVIEPFPLEGRAEWTRNPRPVALITALDGAATSALVSAPPRGGSCIINVTARDDSLRGADCAAGLFHVEASDAMYRDAARIGDGSAVLWDPDFRLYGAGQLNDRYRAATGHPMGPSEWAGWLGVKIAWEAATRVRTGEVGGWLSGQTAAGFDGHKGERLSFRQWDGQLRQPLFVRPKNGSGPMELVPNGQSPDADLDDLGVSERESACRRSPR